MLAGLYKQGTEFFERNRIAPEKREVEVWMEGRYPYQVWRSRSVSTASSREVGSIASA